MLGWFPSERVEEADDEVEDKGKEGDGEQTERKNPEEGKEDGGDEEKGGSGWW